MNSNQAPLQDKNKKSYKPSATQFVARISQEEHIKEKLDDNQQKQSLVVEKITTGKFILFVLYTLSLILFVNIVTEFKRTYDINTSLKEHFLNQRDKDQVNERISAQKPYFENIRIAEEVWRFLMGNVIMGVYDQNKSFKSVLDNNANNVYYYNLFTPMRMLIHRSVMQKSDFRGHVFKERIVMGKEFGSKEAYGPGNAYTYNHEQNGYVQFITAAYVNYTVPIAQMENLFLQGFIDPQTARMQMDFGLYNPVENMITFVQIKFEFSPSSRIKEKEASFTTFKATPYSDSDSAALYVFTTLFFTLYVYYFCQEFVKAFNQIRKGLSIRSADDGQTNQAMQAVGALRDKLRNVVKTLIKYVLSMWTLLDIVSVIMSMMALVIWFQYIGQQRIEKTLSVIQLKNGVADINDIHASPEKTKSYHDLNLNLEIISNRFYVFYRVCAVNVLILVIKTLKYTAKFVNPIRELIEILLLIVERLVPFLVLLFTILLAFAFVGNYYFGEYISDFQSIGTSLRYYVTNLHSNFDIVDKMYDFDQTFSLFFMIGFIFIVNFIFASMFLIYVVHAYMDYYEKQAQEEAEKGAPKSSFHFTPHPVWLIGQFFKYTLPLNVYKRFNKKKHQVLVEKISHEKRSEERELLLYNTFDFNLSINESLKKSSSVTAVYQNEITKNKALKVEKINFVKKIWGTIGIGTLCLIFVLITYEHHKIGQGRSMIESVESLIEQRYVQDFADPTQSYIFELPLKAFQNLIDVKDWTVGLFTHFAFKNTYELKSGEKFIGYYFGGVNYLVTNKYRITVRKRIKKDATNGFFNTIAEKTVTKFFAADQKNPSQGEFKANITGTVSGRTYEYGSNVGYQSAGGYTTLADVQKIATELPAIVEDGLVDASLNSLVIDFPIYQITSDNFMYVALIFELDDAYNVNTQINIDMIGLNYYKTGGQKLLLVLELFMVGVMFYYAYYIYTSVKHRNAFYNYWKTLHIDEFPKLMRQQRAKKEPEFIRKIRYIIEFRQLFDFLLLIFLVISTVLWIIQLTLIADVRRQYKKFLVDANGDGEPDFTGDYHTLITELEEALTLLRILRVTEAAVVIVFAVQVIYYYSYFPQFQFLTKTLAKSFNRNPFMIMILVFFLIGFGLFMQFTIGDQEKEYNDLGSAISYCLESLGSLNKKERRYITNGSSAIFLSLIYYLPFVLFVNYISANLFLGTIYQKYLQAKEESRGVEPNPIPVKEFIQLTLQLLKKKNSNRRVKNFELNDHTLKQFNTTEIWEEFADSVDKINALKEPNTWAKTCSRNLFEESSSRKKLRKLCKEIAKLNFREDAYDTLNKHVSIDDEDKKPEFQLRMMYWNYFRSGSHKLMSFMTYLSEKIGDLDLMTNNNQYVKKKQQSDETIKKYIMALEYQIEQNFTQINEIKNKMDDYKKAHNMDLDQNF